MNTAPILRSALTVVLLGVLAVPWGLKAQQTGSSGFEAVCDNRPIARYLLDGELRKALPLRVGCETQALANTNAPFAEPLLRNYYFSTAQILIALGEFDSAREKIQKAKAIPTNQLILWQGVQETAEGYLIERTGQPGEAERFYRAQSRPSPDSLVRLGALYLEQGRIQEARKAIDDSLQANRFNPAAYAILGDILQNSDRAAALHSYREALRLSEEVSTVVSLTYIEVGARAKRGIARLGG